MSATDGFNAKRKKLLWDSSHRLGGTQSLPALTTHFLSSTLETSRCMRWGRHAHYHHGWEMERADLHNEHEVLGLRGLLRASVTTEKSLIWHHRLVLLLLSPGRFAQGLIVCNYYDFLLYADLCCQMNATLTSAWQFKKFTKNKLQNWTNHLHAKLVNRDNVEQNMWIVSASFIAIRYINSGRDLPRDDPRVQACEECG